jgi:SAM-dependent methyltransferase
MLDLVYGEGSPPSDLSPLGQRLHMWSVRQPACRSVRFRCDLLAEMLDETANLADAPRVLSLACGHLREAARSYAMRCNAISELVAVDQDEESLAEVRRTFAGFRVTTRPGSVRQMLTGAAKVGEFDFVYSAGLYDYLATTVAGALTGALFRALRPGGRLLVANFAPSLRDIGYMEAMMDWHLIYRDDQAMRQLTAAIPANELASMRTFRDELGNVVYLELRRT